MFEGWGDYYIMLGPAAGGLIGLLFVVVTLTTGVDRSKTARGQALYMTPTVLQFAVVLIVSGVALAPAQPFQAVAAVIGFCTLMGLAGALRASLGIRALAREDDPPHWTDFWWYGVAPAVTYLALGATVVVVLAEHALAAETVAVAAMALLLVGIRNAWDLGTWIAPMKNALDSGVSGGGTAANDTK
jgi:L-asparagine transporter-like permease